MCFRTCFTFGVTNKTNKKLLYKPFFSHRIGLNWPNGLGETTVTYSWSLGSAFFFIHRAKLLSKNIMTCLVIMQAKPIF